jgi:hypothetical protein
MSLALCGLSLARRAEMLSKKSNKTTGGFLLKRTVAKK